MTPRNRSFTTQLFRAEKPDELGRRWIHILPAGHFKARDGRGPFDATDLPGILKRTKRHLGETMMMIDYDHQAFSPAVKDGRARALAAGWIGDFEIRDDGLWGLAEFTEAGEKHVAGREYRYLSPSILHDTDGVVYLLYNVALCNRPAMELTSLSEKENSMETEIADLSQLLGLPEGADWDAILDAVRTLKASVGAPDPAKFVAMSVFTAAIAEANSLRQGITQTDAKHHVESLCRAGQLMPSLKDWAITLATANKPALDSFVASVGPSFSRIVEPQLGSRAAASTNLDNAETENEIAKNLGLTTAQFAAGAPSKNKDR